MTGDHTIVGVSGITTDNVLLKEVADNSVFQVNPDEGKVLSVFNAMSFAGAGRKVGSLFFKTFHEYPMRVEFQATAAMSGGGSSITVASSTMFRKYDIIFNPATRARYTVTANPSSSTAIPVAMLDGSTTVAISASQTLIRVGTLVPESWPRPNPKTKAAGSHTSYISTIQESVAWSWHKEQQDLYGGKNEAVRVETRGMYNWKRAINQQLILGEPLDGASTGRYSGAGLLYYGERNNNYTVAENLTQRHLNQAIYIIKKQTGVSRVVMLTGQQIMSEFAYWGYNEGLLQRDTAAPNVWGTGPVTRLNNHHKMNIDPVTDWVFDIKGMDDIVMLWAPELTPPVEYGQALIQFPTKQNPQGVADSGTGDKQGVMTRALSFDNKFPAGSVVVINNVKRIVK